MRKYKVKMTPNVRDKLRDIDHLLDQHYITLRVQATETVKVEVEEDITVERRGRKRSKLGPRTEQKEVSIERYITILQSPKGFIDSLIQKRNLFPPDVIKRVSTDGGIIL